MELEVTKKICKSTPTPQAIRSEWTEGTLFKILKSNYYSYALVIYNSFIVE